MCTLIAFHRVWDDAPLVLAVNRDEAYDRPSRPPEWIEGEPPILAPRDEREGGTWMGATASGLWVGLTNRHEGNVDEERRSRGRLCMDLLASASPAEVMDRIAALQEPYNPFHLVTGDGWTLRRVAYDGGIVGARELEPGCHLVTNRP
ncbi:MAG: NRDE family protein, partial [Gemmatimonadota bacterium]|nr:NRDE family protein [Gemmatimonadota bacterium]